MPVIGAGRLGKHSLDYHCCRRGAAADLEAIGRRHNAHSCLDRSTRTAATPFAHTKRTRPCCTSTKGGKTTRKSSHSPLLKLQGNHSSFSNLSQRINEPSSCAAALPKAARTIQTASQKPIAMGFSTQASALNTIALQPINPSHKMRASDKKSFSEPRAGSGTS